MDDLNSSPNTISTLNSNAALSKLISTVSVGLERGSQRVYLSEIQNLPSPKSPHRIISNASQKNNSCKPKDRIEKEGSLDNKEVKSCGMHRSTTGTPLKHTPSPHSYKMKITPLGRNRRLQEVIYEKQPCTPPCSTGFYNPFEICTESLQLPTVSPHLFKDVVSPSDKEDEKFAWTIDQLAVLHPTNIETSPFNQVDLPLDPVYEKKAQEAIDRYFSAPTVVPSPWTNSSHSINLMSALLSGNSSHLGFASTASPALMHTNNAFIEEVKSVDHIQSAPKTATIWSQTELTFPSSLPKEVEKTLAPFCTFFQDQTQQQDEPDDASNMNNTTLRRKLLFNHEELANITPLCSPRNENARSNMELSKVSSKANKPLPLEEDEAIYPWGVSVIRPSSRLSLSQSPSGSSIPSGSFIRCSLGGEEGICSSPFNNGTMQHVGENENHAFCSRNRGVSPVSLRDVSPIKCSPPSDPFIVHPSNCIKSFYLQSNSGNVLDQHLEPLSVHTGDPILASVAFKPSPLMSPLIDVAHSHCNSFNSSLLQIHCTSADSSMVKAHDKPQECSTVDKPSLSDPIEVHSSHSDSSIDPTNELYSAPNENNYEEKMVNKNNEKLVCYSNVNLGNTCVKNPDKIYEINKQNQVKKGRTPPMKTTSGCSHTKSSPQFSSSPIKNNTYNCSFNSLNASIAEEEDQDRLRNSPKFSESPPVSPIAWSAEEQCNDLTGSSAFKFHQKSLQLDLNEVMVSSSCNLSNPGRNPSSSVLERVISSIGTQSANNAIESSIGGQMLMQTSLDMDVDSQPFLEGSTMDEAYCGQDSGYNTGISSFQSTNYINQTTQNLGSQVPEYKNQLGNTIQMLGSSEEEILLPPPEKMIIHCISQL